jgi:hypothetical protein
MTVVTVRHMIKRGQLEAERVQRLQGNACLVILPMDGTGDGIHTGQPVQNVSRTQGILADLMAAWSTAVLAPVMTDMAAVRQAGERKDDIIRAQPETIGEPRAEPATVRAAQTQQTSDLTPNARTLSRVPTRSPSHCHYVDAGPQSLPLRGHVVSNAA